MSRRNAPPARSMLLLAGLCCLLSAVTVIGPSPASAQARGEHLGAATAARELGQKPLGQKALRYNEAKRIANEGVVSITASGRTTAYSQFADDIRNIIEALPDNNMRIVPIMGKSAGQNLLDILYLRGVDMGIVDQDILDYFKRKDPAFYGDLEKRINFVAKLFNTELHLLAKNDIKTVKDLRGKQVSCLTQMSTVATLCENVFRLLKIDVKIVYEDVDLALLRLKKGEIAAAARAGSTPVPGLGGITAADNLHFLPIDEDSLPNSDFNPIRAAYLPSRLRAEDYPNLIPAGETVPTIATSTLLAVYAWPPESRQYQEISRFIQLFFGNVDKFRLPPRHPKWRDVNLAADVPGWRRFPAAQAWLDNRRLPDTANTASISGGGDAKVRSAFDKFLADLAASDSSAKSYRPSRGSALCPVPALARERGQGPALSGGTALRTAIYRPLRARFLMRRLLCFMLAVSALLTPPPKASCFAQGADLAGRPARQIPLVVPDEAIVASGARFVMIRGLPRGLLLSQGFPSSRRGFSRWPKPGT